MKKKMIVGLCLFFMGISFVHAATNPYSKTQTFNGKESVPCTYIAWQETYNRLGIALPGGWGNAVNWLKSAKKAGYQVGETPKPNSLAVYSGYYGYGHVAYVIEVYEDYMHIVEGGVVGAEKAERNTSFEIGAGDGIYLTGFIYLDEVPKNNNTTTSTTTTSKSSTTTKKDDNSYLKTLKIEGIDFDFQKETFTYLLNVPNEIETIKLTLEAEKKTSKIESQEEYQLEIGENTISIKVIAEDESSSTYNLYITREEPKEEIIETIVEEPSTKKVSWKVIIPIIVFVVLSIIGIVVFLIKRKLRLQKSKK